jgi:hypothetical protein
MKKMGFPPEMYDAVPRNLAGWHSIIDALTAAVDGAGGQQGTPQENAGDAEWKKLHRMYTELYS